MVDGGWAAWKSWLWPGQCRLCRASLPFGESLCEGCHADLPWNRTACGRCATPLPSGDGARECGRCQRRTPPYSQTVSLFRYESPVDHLVIQLKFHRELALARLFGELLTARLDGKPGVDLAPDVLVPVPLHRARLRERGYNQALEIARVVGSALSIPVDINGVQRTRHTRAQSDLSLAERRKNLHGAFDARRDYRGLRVAIVDDVMTSGTTVEALAKCLRKAGATEIHVWVAARAGLNRVST